MRALGYLALAAVLVAGLGSRVLAGAFEEGLAAYDQGDYATAMETFRGLSTEGNASATYNIGVMFFNGQGVATDIAEAIVWFQKGADQGSPDSQVKLGVIYALGRGVPKDYPRALGWFELAAYQGDPLGQFYLGRMYELGLGTEKNLDGARGWYRVAASHGEPMAVERLKLLAHDTAAVGAAENAPAGGEGVETASTSPAGSANEATPPDDTGAAGPAYRVHLASFRSPGEVDEEWRLLRKRRGDLLAGLEATSKRVDLGAEKGVYYRLLAGPLPSRAAARRFCQRLKQESPEAWCNPVKVRAE